MFSGLDHYCYRSVIRTSRSAGYFVVARNNCFARGFPAPEVSRREPDLCAAQTVEKGPGRAHPRARRASHRDRTGRSDRLGRGGLQPKRGLLEHDAGAVLVHADDPRTLRRHPLHRGPRSGSAERPDGQQRWHLAAHRRIPDRRHGARLLVHLREERPAVRHATLQLHPRRRRDDRRHAHVQSTGRNVSERAVGDAVHLDGRCEHPVHSGRFHADGVFGAVHGSDHGVGVRHGVRDRGEVLLGELAGGVGELHDRDVAEQLSGAVRHPELRPERADLRSGHVRGDHPVPARRGLQRAEGHPDRAVHRTPVRAPVQAWRVQRYPRRRRLLHLRRGARAEPGRRRDQR